MAAEDGLSTALDELAGLGLLPDHERRRIEETSAKITEAVVFVALLGDFKRGKSTLINALLGDTVLPTGVVPVTAVPTLCRWGPRRRLVIRLAEEFECPLAELHQYVSESGNPANERGVREVVLEHPCPLLQEGLVLVDTPGTGSLHLHNTETARGFLPRVDVAVVVLTADAPLSAAEARLVGEANDDAARIAVCLNKIDLLTALDIRQAVDFVRAGITRIVDGNGIPVFPVSARGEGAGHQRGFSALRDWLQDQVVAQREGILRERAVVVGQQAYQLATAALRMERAALEMPMEQATMRRQALRDALDSLELDTRAATALLVHTRRLLADTTLAEAADSVRRSLPETLLAEEEEGRRWDEIQRQLVTSWTGELEERLTADLWPAVRRHADSLQECLQQFIDVAADLFAVELPSAPGLSGTLAIPHVRVEFADEPGALAMGIRGLRERLPGRLGGAWRRSARREAAAEAADRLAGRLRHAADQALDRVVRGWSAASDEQWRAVAAALCAAIDRRQAALVAGLDRRQAAADRLQALETRLSHVSLALERVRPTGEAS